MITVGRTNAGFKQFEAYSNSCHLTHLRVGWFFGDLTKVTKAEKRPKHLNQLENRSTFSHRKSQRERAHVDSRGPREDRDWKRKLEKNIFLKECKFTKIPIKYPLEQLKCSVHAKFEARVISAEAGVIFSRRSLLLTCHNTKKDPC